MSSPIAVCTLYEGDYHYGVGALANSLHASGFNGTMWVGTRGERPPWSSGDSKTLPNGLELRFLDLDTPYHFSHYKPWFMQDVLNRSDSECVAYIDPDIVSKAPWTFFEDWLSRGVALVGDFYEAISEDHLYRHHWREHAVNVGQTQLRKIDRYFNGGFLGVSSSQVTLLDAWAMLVEGLPKLGLPIDKLLPATALHPFQFTDQDMLNAALECGAWTLATLPPSGMDLRDQIGGVMCHMTPGAKPWRTGYFRGQKKWRYRSHAARMYWQHTQSPIDLYSKRERAMVKIDQKLEKVFGRFYAIPGWRP